uniref:Uncharacterized protein n=1 Tax=Plectus sambesii TaxID=2011161 RepID=A0A914WRN4_9BILA
MDFASDIAQASDAEPQNASVDDSMGTGAEEGGGLTAQQLEEFDLAEIGKPLIDPHTGKYRCQICAKNRSFASADSFRAHRIRSHGTIRNTIVCPVDSACPKMASVFTFRAHLAKEHDFHAVAQRFAFASREDFLRWKEEIEKETVAFFVRFQAARKSGHEQWHCNRSRTSRSHHSVEEQLRREQLGKSEGSRKRKDGQDRVMRQSSKMGAQCPAMISVRYTAKFVEVEAYLDHLGHEHDIRFLPVSETARERIRALLQEGYSPDKVLQIVKREAVPGDRTHRLNVKAVHCIQQRDQERINQAHLEANYLVVQPELIVETKPGMEWLVQSSKDNQQISVMKAEFGCPNEECHMRCESCQVCPHTYYCSCARKVKLPCKHIHGVHILYGQRSFCERTLHYEEEEEIIEETDHSGHHVVDYPGEERGSGEPANINVASSSSLPLKQSSVVRKVGDQAKRLTDKMTKLTAMWEALPLEALGDASEVADRLEDLLNEAIAKALTVLPLPTVTAAAPRTAVNVPHVDVSSYFSPTPPKKKRGRPPKKETTEKAKVAEIFTNKQGVQDNYLRSSPRRPVIFDHTKYSLTRFENSSAKHDSGPPSLIPAVVATTTSKSASGPVIVDPSKFPFARSGSSFRMDIPVHSPLIAASNVSTASSGKVIVLKYSKQRAAGNQSRACAGSGQQYSTPSTLRFANKAPLPQNLTPLLESLKPSPARLSATASGLQLRPIRAVVRCIACYRVIGANSLTAKKCPKCEQWCHHICAHLCVD